LLKCLLPDDWEYIYLSGNPDLKHEYIIPTLIHAPLSIGAFAYMINKKGITKLIKYCTRLVTTYDNMIMEKILYNQIKGYMYLPFMIYHSSQESLVWTFKSPKHLNNYHGKHISYKYFKHYIEYLY